MSFNPINKLWWRNLGKRGETLAARHLEQHGYTIWHKNWRCRIGELDIIALKAKVLAFIEIRTRVYNRPSDIRARDSIGPQKQAKLINLIEIFLQYNESKIEDLKIQFIRRDVLGVEFHPGKKVVIDHIEDAF